MTLSNYQITFNGLSIGAETNYQILNIDGLGGTSPLRIQDENRGYIDGSYTGRDFYDERTVIIDMLILGDNTTTAQQNYAAFQKAFSPQPVGYYPDPTLLTPPANELKLFQFQLTADTGPKRMYGRVRNITTPVNADFTYGYIETRVQLTFPDPRYYDDAGTTHTGSTVTVTNTGWATSCPVITIPTAASSGEITDGTIGSASDGFTHMYFGNMTGDDLTVDLLTRIIYYGNYSTSVPARNFLLSNTNGWLNIPPNTTSPVTWKTNLGSMYVTYRNAFI
jgi:hypothetical protein